MLSVTIFAAALGFALFGLVCYRLFLHPLAGVPGPKLAAVTTWYEFYYECIQGGGGQVAHLLDRLHERYGPIVRINPWEVHISGDPSFYETFYAEPKLDKDLFFWACFGRNGSMGSTLGADLHRTRRGVIAPCFSMANVRKLEPAILASMHKLLGHLDTYRIENRVANLSDAFRCFSAATANVISLPKPHLQLDDVNFANPLGKGLRAFASLLGWDRHLKFVLAAVTVIPQWLTAKMDSTGGIKAVANFLAMFKENAEAALERRENMKVGQTPLTVLDFIVASSKIPAADKSVLRLVDEANNVSAAGTETTGAALAALTFHLLSNPEILSKLKAELSTAAESAGTQDKGELLPLRALEKLPYLQACLNETLRVCPSVSGRSPRINRFKTLTYHSPSGRTYTLPAGTTISMSIRDLHQDPTAFPQPKVFRPERWLEADERMQKHFVPFGRGARSCVGSELAKVELVLVAGNLFHNVEMELFETRERDVSMAHDWFAPFGPDDSEGVRVKVKALLAK